MSIEAKLLTGIDRELKVERIRNFKGPIERKLERRNRTNHE